MTDNSGWSVVNPYISMKRAFLHWPKTLYPPMFGLFFGRRGFSIENYMLFVALNLFVVRIHIPTIRGIKTR
jgi:hypothetical protein